MAIRMGRRLSRLCQQGILADHAKLSGREGFTMRPEPQAATAQSGSEPPRQGIPQQLRRIPRLRDVERREWLLLTRDRQTRHKLPWDIAKS